MNIYSNLPKYQFIGGSGMQANAKPTSTYKYNP